MAKYPKRYRNIFHSCEICQNTRNVPKEIVDSKWPHTSYPFERIHLDFFHLNGKTFLILVDAYSKFIDINIMKTTVVSAVIGELQKFLRDVMYLLIGLNRHNLTCKIVIYVSTKCHSIKNILR